MDIRVLKSRATFEYSDIDSTLKNVGAFCHFTHVTHVAELRIERRVTFLLSRENCKRSNVNLLLAHEGGGRQDCSHKHARVRVTNARACIEVGSRRAWAMLWHATRPLRSDLAP